MNDQRQLMLNFVAIQNQFFNFAIYRRLSSEIESLPDNITRYSLGEDDDRQLFDISFDYQDGFEKYECNPNDNNGLTVAYINYLIQIYIKDNPEYLFVDDKKRYFEYMISHHPQGQKIISIRTYYLKSLRKFGFLLKSKFRLDDEASYSRDIQILNGRIKENGHINYDYNSETYYLLEQ